jgi:hypothetical protein
VRDQELRKVFQVGFSLTLKLKFRADRLAKQPLAKLDDVDLILPEELSVVAALRRKRPLRALKVEGAEPVPFRSRRELAEAESSLERAERQVELFRELLGGTEEAARAVVARFGVPLETLGTERLWTALVASAVLDPSLPPGPVPAARFRELGDRLFEKGPDHKPRLRADARDRAVAALEPKVPEAAKAEFGRMVDRTLGRLLMEVGHAYISADGKPDPSLSVILPIQGMPLL